MEEKKKEQKKKLHFHWWHLCYVFAGLAALWWFNNYTIRVNKNAYVTEKVSKRFRIAVISDLHVHEGGITGEKVLSKMLFHGSTTMAFGRLVTTTEQIKEIRKVTPEDIIEVAREVLVNDNRSVSWVVPTPT